MPNTQSFHHGKIGGGLSRIVRQKAQLKFASRFVQGFSRVRRSGRVREGEIEYALEFFEHGEPLSANWHDHPLTAEWTGHREFHLSGAKDNLVIYKQRESVTTFVAIGSHQDLFLHRKLKKKGSPRPAPNFDELVEKVRGGGEALAPRAARLLKSLWRG